MSGHLLNYIEEIKRKLEPYLSLEYIDFYKTYSSNTDVVEILSTLHYLLISEFRAMNTRLPTGNSTAHFWASDSRILINAIENAFKIVGLFKANGIGIVLDSYYEEIMNKCREFLSSSYGSEIPEHMDSIEIYSKTPVFVSSKTIDIPEPLSRRENLTFVGEGSYAEVYKFTDNFYKIDFALKRAKRDLDDKELTRFKNEYLQLSLLSSPYIVKVYRYNQEKNEYVMEYLDTTVYSFYQSNFKTLTMRDKKNYVFQFLRGLSYIHSKGLLHRDLSPLNVMVKCYEDLQIIKITDFGLVKVENSNLTSAYSSIKGCYNDPSLKIDGFSNYDFTHEIYAATLICVFMLTGVSTDFSKVKDPNIRAILNKGTNPDRTLRYTNINQLYLDINRIN